MTTLLFVERCGINKKKDDLKGRTFLKVLFAVILLHLNSSDKNIANVVLWTEIKWFIMQIMKFQNSFWDFSIVLGKVDHTYIKPYQRNRIVPHELPSWRGPISSQDTV
jgi:hypothetical protein